MHLHYKYEVKVDPLMSFTNAWKWLVEYHKYVYAIDFSVVYNPKTTGSSFRFTSNELAVEFALSLG